MQSVLAKGTRKRLTVWKWFYNLSVNVQSRLLRYLWANVSPPMHPSDPELHCRAKGLWLEGKYIMRKIFQRIGSVISFWRFDLWPYCLPVAGIQTCKVAVTFLSPRQNMFNFLTLKDRLSCNSLTLAVLNTEVLWSKVVPALGHQYSYCS